VTIDGKRYRRETNTMPQWAGSCWYYLRYLDPKNPNAFCDPAKAKHWLPVDLYVGGAEHAVLHLLYSRFWHKVLYDRGHLPTAEPFQRLINQGMILGEMEYHISPEDRDAHAGTLTARGLHVVKVEEDDDVVFVLKAETQQRGMLRDLSEEEVEKRKGKLYLKGTDIELTGTSEKMSKSRGNVINPDDVIEQYGADSLRLYEMFMGPLEAVKPWNMRGVVGVYRFLDKVWRLIVDDRAETPTLHPNVKDVEPDAETLKLLHKTMKKVTEDTESLRFNTAIAAMMEFSNHLTSKGEVRSKKVLAQFVQILAPYAPHIAEELWQVLGGGGSSTLAYEPWPPYDPALVRDDEIEIPVQINGKVKAKLMVPAEADAAALEKLALSDTKVQEQIAGKTVKKVIAKPKQMVSIVVG
jgi:leucyl-tRNA synthetase